MNLTWYIIRGSGIVAFALLASSLIWGLLVSGKVFGRAVKAKGLQWLHESLGLAALLATVVHLVAVSMDEYIDFTWMDVLLPGVGDWNPIALTLGIMSFWTMALVSLSFYVKKLIGQQLWRAIHFLSFGVFASALAHGVLAGTDTSNVAIASMYIASVVAAVLLTTIRVITAREPARTTRRTPPVRESTLSGARSGAATTTTDDPA